MNNPWNNNENNEKTNERILKTQWKNTNHEYIMNKSWTKGKWNNEHVVRRRPWINKKNRTTQENKQWSIFRKEQIMNNNGKTNGNHDDTITNKWKMNKPWTHNREMEQLWWTKHGKNVNGNKWINHEKMGT